MLKKKLCRFTNARDKPVSVVVRKKSIELKD